jgi:hypothetical protein
MKMNRISVSLLLRSKPWNYKVNAQRCAPAVLLLVDPTQ